MKANKYCIKLKQAIDKNDFEAISNLENICLEHENMALKLELDYKISRSEELSKCSLKKISNINEFMFYEGDDLVGYLGICQFGGSDIEINGIVHPEHRRKGIFTRLSSLAKEEFAKRDSSKMLFLSDNKSVAGIEFIKTVGANYYNSEYEMYLKKDINIDRKKESLEFVKAKNSDAEEIAKQNSVYFGVQVKAEDFPLPEDEEKRGTTTYLVKLQDEIVGKFNIGTYEGVGGIFGVGVMPKYRGRGFGRCIINTAIEKLEQEKAEKIMLQVAVQNEKALNLYKSCGFHVTSVMDYYELKK